MTVNINDAQTGEIVLSDYEGFGFIAMFTDRFVGGRISSDGRLTAEITCKYDNLLDLRVFNKDKELHIYRGSIGDKLKFRLACDENLDLEYFFDEHQLLDIDTIATKINKNGMLVSTRGGEYRLPLSSAEDDAVVIRNYLSYDVETGRAQIIDFRVVKFGRARDFEIKKEGK